MTERNAKKILLQILQQARDEATSPDPADLGVLADRFLERWPSSPLPDSETERQRWFVIAGPGTPTELGERPLEADWDGVVYPGLTADLAASLAACRQTYDDWGVYELVRVPDPEVTS